MTKNSSDRAFFEQPHKPERERLEYVRMHFSSKLESVRIGMCRNRKVSESESVISASPKKPPHRVMRLL